MTKINKRIGDNYLFINHFKRLDKKKKDIQLSKDLQATICMCISMDMQDSIPK